MKFIFDYILYMNISQQCNIFNIYRLDATVLQALSILM